MKNYTIKYEETYSDVYDIEAADYNSAVKKLDEMIREGQEIGPLTCIDSHFEPVCENPKETADRVPEGKWFYADIEGIDEDLKRISMPVVVCDQCNTFFPVAYAGGGHRYCPNCGRRMAPADEANQDAEESSSVKKDVDVTIAAEFRYTTRIYGECVDTSDCEKVIDAARIMFGDADVSEMECIGFEAVSIQTPDGDFIWER